MPTEVIMQYLGDEVPKVIPVQDPQRNKYDAIIAKANEIGAEFFLDPKNEGDITFCKEFRNRSPRTRKVLEFRKGNEPLRRFPHTIENGEPVYTSKRANATGDVFRFTGKILDDGTPEYTCRVKYTSSKILKDIKTQVGKLPMYREIEEVSSTEKELIKENIALKEELEAAKNAKPEPEPEAVVEEAEPVVEETEPEKTEEEPAKKKPGPKPKKG